MSRSVLCSHTVLDDLNPAGLGAGAGAWAGTAAATLGIPAKQAVREDPFGKSPSGRGWVGEAGGVRQHSLGSRREAGAAQ